MTHFESAGHISVEEQDYESGAVGWGPVDQGVDAQHGGWNGVSFLLWVRLCDEGELVDSEETGVWGWLDRRVGINFGFVGSEDRIAFEVD